MASIDRRSFLLGTAGTAGAGLLLAACGDDDTDTATGDTAGAPGEITEPSGEIAFLVPTFPDGFRTSVSTVVAGTAARVAYVVRDETAELRDDAPASVDFQLTAGDGAEVFSGPVAKRGDGVITPYYAIEFTPPAPGVFTVGLPGFPDVVPHQFRAVAAADNVIPLVGATLPAVDTATFDDPRGVTPICTRAEPCPFHRVNLADALAAGDKPIVVSIATPGFCQTAICGPVIELLIGEAADREDLHVIHAEVYVDPQSDFGGEGGFPTTTDIVAAYGLPFEPALFVCAPDGTILARLDTIYDRSELADALALV